MFTQLVTALLQHMASAPAILCYTFLAVWVGLDSSGIPLPMEPALLLAGALAATGNASFVLAMASAVVGALVFASAAYAAGQRYGRSFAMRVGRHVGLTPARVDHIEVWLEQQGALGVFFATVCPIVRTYSASIMGDAGVPRRRFVLCVLFAALAYDGPWLLLGWVAGAIYRPSLGLLDSIGFVGFLILAVLVAAIIALHHCAGRLALSQITRHFSHYELTQAEAEAAATAYLDATLASRGVVQIPAPRPRSVVARTATAPPRPLIASASPELSVPLQRLWTWIERTGRDLRAEVTARWVATPSSQGDPAAPSAVWPDWVGAVITFALSELALALLMLAVAAHFFPTFPFDPGVAAQIQRLNGTPFAEPIRLAGDLQWFQPAAVSYVLIFGTLLALRKLRALICAAASVVGADLFNVVVNTLVARPRPHGVRVPTLIGQLGEGSFPSGHVAHTVGLYGFVFFLCVLAMRTTPRWKPYLIAVQGICVYFILFVGLSRVTEGAHWPSDVLGGYLSGSLMLSIVIVLYHVLALRAVRAQPALVARPALAVAG